MNMDQTFTIKRMISKRGIDFRTFKSCGHGGSVVGRQESKYRAYAAKNLGWVHVVKCLRNIGISVKQVQQCMGLTQGGEQTSLNRQKLLETHQACVEDQREKWIQKLTMIRMKIAYYQQVTGGNW